VPAGGLQLIPGGPLWFHPVRSARIQMGPKNVIGAFGELHPRTLEAIGAEGPVAGFELILDDIPAPKLRSTKTKPKLELAELMPVRRDFAFLANRSVNAADIVKAAASAESALVASVGVFDVYYQGTGMPEGKKSVAIAVTLQPRGKTLTESEIDAAAGKIVAEVTNKTGAILRG
jgi:phenylalanyl-tRNA synthetase beta chain